MTPARDLTRVTLVRDDTPTETTKRYPHAGPLLGARWNEDLVAGCWPDLLRMAGSLKYGQATASLIVGKWSAASRQNTLAAALKEWACYAGPSTWPNTCRTQPSEGRSPGHSGGRRETVSVARSAASSLVMAMLDRRHA
ncbi:Tn3 family transposase [Nonomuraea africana]|uniref:Tn3 family transposase n=1 Tax=Nonomuraea africana TaxID=46171 RepID=UPI001789E613